MRPEVRVLGWSASHLNDCADGGDLAASQMRKLNAGRCDKCGTRARVAAVVGETAYCAGCKSRLSTEARVRVPARSTRASVPLPRPRVNSSIAADNARWAQLQIAKRQAARRTDRQRREDLAQLAQQAGVRLSRRR